MSELHNVEYRRPHERELPAVAALIADLNVRPEHHCVHTDEDVPSVMRAIAQLDVPATEAFAVAVQEGKIVGVMGCDSSVAAARGWLWGPFVATQPWDPVADRLFEQLCGQLPSGIRRLSSFTDLDNTRGLAFYERYGFVRQGITHVFQAERPPTPVAIAARCPLLEEQYHEAFKALHDEEFPGTYLSGEDILAKADELHRVFMHAEGGELSGYLYAAPSDTSSEGFIHFVAVRSERRGQGIGRRLLLSALQWLFDEQGFPLVGLTVNDDRVNARRLYESVGFRLKYSGASGRKDL